MKKFFSILLLLFAFTTTANAQSLLINTTHFVGGASSCGGTACQYAIPTRDSGIFFAGTTDCAVGGGDIPPNFAGEYNVVVGKLDSNLNVLWVKVYGGSLNENVAEPGGAVQTSDGGYAVLSSTASNDRDVSGNHSSGGLQDLWLIKLDSLGNLLWQKCYGSPYDDDAMSVTVTKDNGFILCGLSNGIGGDVTQYYGWSDFFIVKTDSMGNKQWVKTIGGTGMEAGGTILVANTGYYLVGSSNSRNYDCNDTFWHPNQGCGMDYWMFRLDDTGKILWDSSYGGSDNEWIYQAILDPKDSSILINGTTWSPNDYMVTNYKGDGDYWVIKTNKYGKLLWEKCLGTINQENGNGLCLSKNGGYSVYGNTGPGIIGETDCWVFELDTLGDSITSKEFGGIYYETPTTIFPFKTGFLTTGQSNSLNFTEGINVGILPNDYYDAYFSYINYITLSINEVKTNDNILSLYPNPATCNIIINLPKTNGILIIKNILG